MKFLTLFALTIATVADASAYDLDGDGIDDIDTTEEETCEGRECRQAEDDAWMNEAEDNA